jgi:hypothetical protein
MEGYTASADVLVSDDIDKVMLGIDWLSAHNCVWNFGGKTIALDGQVMLLSTD